MTKLLTPEAEKAMSLPVGIVSPLWLMFAGAAAAGAAVFWARAWLKPTHLEAVLEPLPEAVVEPAVETTEVVADAVADAAEVVADAAAETAEVVAEPVVETVAEAVDATPALVEAVVADDLTVLTGIGPKLAQLLAERGVTRFAQIAAWTEADVEHFDKDLKLMGRIGREAWIAQARRHAELLAG